MSIDQLECCVRVYTQEIRNSISCEEALLERLSLVPNSLVWKDTQNSCLLACCEEGSKKSYRRRWTAGNSLVVKPLPYRHSCLYIVLFFDTLPLFVVVSRWGLFHTAWKERYRGYGQQGPAYKWISVLYHVTARSLDGHEICCFRVRITALCIKTWKITALLLLLNISKKKSEKRKRDLATALPDSYLTTPINEWEGALCIRYPINWTLEVCIYSVLWMSNDRSQMKMNSLS